jgi:hypothetical protein
LAFLGDLAINNLNHRPDGPVDRRYPGTGFIVGGRDPVLYHPSTAAWHTFPDRWVFTRGEGTILISNPGGNTFSNDKSGWI